MNAPALVVDRKGLAKKLAHRSKSFVLFELLQNSWDENVTEVRVAAEMVPGRQVCRILVEDDAPEGFQTLESIYTLFRDSKKSNDPEKRGRFELGEKLVAALAIRMEVITTKGCVIIEGDSRVQLRKKTDRGSAILVDIKMTREEYREVCDDVYGLIPPKGIRTWFNGLELLPRQCLHRFEASLQTVKTDQEGNLVHAVRKTVVQVLPVLPGETAHIYEMGIPVMETGDKWHYNVQQKVPVNWERNSVPPKFLKTLRVEALNAMHGHLSPEDSKDTWVTDAIDDVRIKADAVRNVITSRFGEKVVINDLSDPEGTKIAVSQGYTVIPGGTFSKQTWANIRDSDAARPAGQVTPSPKPYSPEGRPERVIPEEDWTADMRRIVKLAKEIFQYIYNEPLQQVVIAKEPQVSWSANYGQGRLCLNYGRLGKDWFGRPNRDSVVIDLLIHEFVHHVTLDHLSDDMHETATWIGAKLIGLALDHPEVFHGG